MIHQKSTRMSGTDLYMTLEFISVLRLQELPTISETLVQAAVGLMTLATRMTQLLVMPPVSE